MPTVAASEERDHKKSRDFCVSDSPDAASGPVASGPSEGAARAGRAKPDRAPSAPSGGEGGRPAPFGSHNGTNSTSGRAARRAERRESGGWDARTYYEERNIRLRLSDRLCACAPLAGDSRSHARRDMLTKAEALRRCGPLRARFDRSSGDALARLERGGRLGSACEVHTCKTQWCPTCGRRKSGRRAQRLGEHIHKSEIEPLFVTLTMRPDPARSMRDGAEMIKAAFRRLVRRNSAMPGSKAARARRHILGYTMQVEGTWAESRGWHVHIHALIDVAGRRDGRPWWPHADLLGEWRRALGTPDDPANGGARIERIANVAEAVKYAVKPAEVLNLPAAVFTELVTSFGSGRPVCRLFTCGGTLAHWDADEDEERDEVADPILVNLRTGAVVPVAAAEWLWVGQRTRTGLGIEEAVRRLEEWAARIARGHDPPMPDGLCVWEH